MRLTITHSRLTLKLANNGFSQDFANPNQIQFPSCFVAPEYKPSFLLKY